MAKRGRTALPAPFLRGLRFRSPDEPLPARYPFELGWVTPDFEMTFEQPVTILMGENGAGKSTLLEAIAAIAGFSTSGGGAWAGGPLDPDADGVEALAARLVGGWLPKISAGWFLKAQSFSAVAGMTAGDYLARSHGEGFSEIISDRMVGQGLYLFDEPEAALSPRKQAELLGFLADVQRDADAQVVLATHSPMLMSVPGAEVFCLTHRGITRVDPRQTDHFRFWSAFTADPEGFVAAVLADDLDNLI